MRLIAQCTDFKGDIAGGIEHLNEIHAIGSRIVSAVGDNERLFATEHHTRSFKFAIPAVVETGSSFQRIGLFAAAEALNPAVVASEREIRITVMFAAGAILGRQSDGERLPHILLHVHADERPIFPTHGDGIGIISLPSGWARFCNEISETAGINECAHRVEQFEGEMRLAINFVVGVLHYDSVLHKQYRSVLGDGQSEIHSLALCPTLPIAQTYRSHLIARCSGELITRVRIRFTRDIMPCYSAVCTPITTIYHSGIGIRIGEVAVLSYDVRIIEIQIIHAMLSDIIEEQVIELAPRAGVGAADGAHSERIDALSDGIAMYGISRLREVIDHSYGRVIIDKILDLIL